MLNQFTLFKAYYVDEKPLGFYEVMLEEHPEDSTDALSHALELQQFIAINEETIGLQVLFADVVFLPASFDESLKQSSEAGARFLKQLKYLKTIIYSLNDEVRLRVSTDWYQAHYFSDIRFLLTKLDEIEASGLSPEHFFLLPKLKFELIKLLCSLALLPPHVFKYSIVMPLMQWLTKVFLIMSYTNVFKIHLISILGDGLGVNASYMLIFLIILSRSNVLDYLLCFLEMHQKITLLIENFDTFFEFANAENVERISSECLIDARPIEFHHMHTLEHCT
jgi:hypothetical protein